MGVFTPERERTESAPAPPPPEPPRREPPGRDVPWALVVLCLLIIGIAVGVGWLRGVLPDFDNPFASETIDRSGPAVLRSIQNLHEYHAASGNFQVIVDLEEDTALPDELLGTRTLFIAAGTVDATVDFSQLGGDSVEVSQDRRAATITLPRPQLGGARVDPGRSYVYDQQRGVFNKIGALFSDDPNDERRLYLLAEDKLAEAARGGAGLVPRAEENTRRMLTSLLGSLGFTTVVVRFEPQ
jgi:Protein of unknown function (DUF4230)